MLPRLVTFTYILQFPHSLGEQPALNVAFILGFKEFEASGVLKSSYAGRSFAWTSLHKSLSWTAPCCRRSAESSLSDTLGISSLEEDRS